MTSPPSNSIVEFRFCSEKPPSWPKRAWHWLWNKDVQLLELKRAYRLSFRSNAAISSWDWRDKQKTSKIESVLARMLVGKMSREQITWTAANLHKLLFPSPAFDVAYFQALQQSIDNKTQKEIQIVSEDEESVSFLTNLPWEAVEDVSTSTETDERFMLGTIAHRPVVRVAPYSVSRSVEEARVRVLCCISNPKGDVIPFDAPAFEGAIKKSLGAQPVDLHFSAPDYLPDAERAFAEIKDVQPHVFIFIGHGRSDTGNPRLRFEEWTEIEELARRLDATGQVLLVILIACDQSRLIQAPAAQSGAVTLLRHNVPAVVAMQGYIHPEQAEVFLRVFMQTLFITDSISQSAAQGRVEMNRKAREERWNSDWILPVVFRGLEKEWEQDQFSKILGHYQPSSESLLSFITPPMGPHLPRLELESKLLAVLNESSGLLHISGGVGNGRTHLVRVVARVRIDKAVNDRAVLPRPIFYIDLDECPEPSTARWFLRELRQRFTEVRFLISASTLSTLYSSELVTQERVGRMIPQLDRSRVVLIVDHIREDDTGFWTQFLRLSTGLQQSLVIAVADDEAVLPVDVPVLEVPPLSAEETQSYVTEFMGEGVNEADNLYQRTGGTPLLLDAFRLLKKSAITLPASILSKKEVEVAGDYIETVNEILSFEEFNALCIFWWFQGLIEVEAASVLIPSEDAIAALIGLVEKGVLSKTKRSGKEWLSLASLKSDGLKTMFESELVEAAELLVQYFEEIVGENAQAKITDLALRDSGIPLLRGVQSAYLRMGQRKKALDLAVVLAGPLQDQPLESFRFFNGVLSDESAPDIPQDIWIYTAGLAREAGEVKTAQAFLSKVEPDPVDPYQRASWLNTKATILKDLGKSENTDEILAYYDEAISLTQAGTRENIQSEAATASADDWAQLMSVLLHNRAATLQFFARRSKEALEDIKRVQVLEEKRNTILAASAMSQEVDFRLSQPASIDDWDSLLILLRKAYRTLELERSKRDFAYCCYQYARYYRKRPANSETERAQNLRTAAAYYLQTARIADEAGDLKRKAAAVKHWVQVSWHELENLSAAEAADSLDTLIPTLNEYHGDAFAMRLLRDMLFLRARTELSLGGTDSNRLLKEASRVSVRDPLKPAKRGEDRSRTLEVFMSYLEHLQTQNNQEEAEQFLADQHTLFEEWLGKVKLDQPWIALLALREMKE